MEEKNWNGTLFIHIIFEPYELFIEHFNLNFKIRRDYYKNFLIVILYIYNTMNLRTLEGKHTDISIYTQFLKNAFSIQVTIEKMSLNKFSVSLCSGLSEKSVC